MKTLQIILVLVLISTSALAQKELKQSLKVEHAQAVYDSGPGEPGPNSNSGESPSATSTLPEGQFGPVLVHGNGGQNTALDDIQTTTNENIDPRISTPHDRFSSSSPQPDTLSDNPNASAKPAQPTDQQIGRAPDGK